ncbi:DUF2283 domain-containing protein [Desulfobacula sp.]|uniref:DUF2283 domain-containing protein n=1 Tax=Desulfobacula sp. TaxID=2593537 RepID=UPI001EC525A0|nr:DUF2283 domain-containing protein [Desulfobacula sp.]
MKIKYNKNDDVLLINFSTDKIDESSEEKPGIIFDYDKNGKIVSIEIIQASKKMINPDQIDIAI